MIKPTHSVRVVIFDKTDKGRFLLLSEVDDPENFKLPGGKFFDKETPDNASKREIFEELKITVDKDNLQYAGELLNDDGISKRFIYQMTVNPDEISPSDEIAKIIWTTIDTMPETKNRNHILSAISLCKKVSI